MDNSTLMPQQRRIMETLDHPLFVSAGAGSGKTFTLTKRVVWALSPESGEDGKPFCDSIDQILAITFTKKAASELKERIRNALMDEGMLDQALKVDDAWISTIHGMCSRLLKNHALELGIDPEFVHLDELVVSDLKYEAVAHVIGRLRTQREWKSFFEAYPMSGGQFGSDSIFSLALRALDKFNVASSTEKFFSPDESFDIQDIADAFSEYEHAVAADGKRVSASAAEKIAASREALESIELNSAESVIDLYNSLKYPSARGDLKPYVINIRAVAAETLLNAYIHFAGNLSEQIVELGRACFEEYSNLKREMCGLDNDDLLRLACNALEQHPDLAQLYKQRFRMVMVDEFQDTSTSQIQLISHLCQEGQRNLCTVGDAQQSIYRFRGADVSVFQKQEAKIAADTSGEDDLAAGELVQLVRNFRSHAEVLEYVAQVFGGPQGLMTKFLDLEASDMRKDSYHAQGISRRQAILIEKNDPQYKGAAIARHLREMVDAGQRPSDMVILLGSMSHADVYAQELRRVGLDAVITGGSVFAKTPEAAWVAAILDTLSNVGNTSHGLMPLLVSPLFMCGASQLLELATRTTQNPGEVARRNLDAALFSELNSDDEILSHAVGVIQQALRHVGNTRMSDVVREIVNGSGVLSRLAKQGPSGQSSAANLLKAIEIVEQIEVGIEYSPRSVCTAYNAYLETSKDTPGALSSYDFEAADQGAVRLMTVHSSKGLEFPIVVVADCFSVTPSRSNVSFIQTSHSTAVVALPSSSTVARRDASTTIAKMKKALREAGDDFGSSTSAIAMSLEAQQEDFELDMAERYRLLYVAMTRAREACILAMNVPFSKKSNFTMDVCNLIQDAADPTKLVFDNARSGDFELCTQPLEVYRRMTYTHMLEHALVNQQQEQIEQLKAQIYTCDVRLAQTFTQDELQEQFACEDITAAPFDYSLCTQVSNCSNAPQGSVMDDTSDAEKCLELVTPCAVKVVRSDARRMRSSYSYSSLAHAQDEAAAEDSCRAQEAIDEFDSQIASNFDTGKVKNHKTTPTEFGSAFHALAQLMVEGNIDYPTQTQIDSLSAFWKVDASHRVRLNEALKCWASSAVRKEALTWDTLRAEVPFFSQGMGEYGAYAEGAIDLLCTNAGSTSCLVIDYKTGGSAAETSEELLLKHQLQAQVYSDVLHKAGYKDVTCKFVRVEVEDPEHPGQPQVVEYHL